MPTVLRSGPYRVFFYSDEGTEPPHVHVVSGRSEAKYWIDPVRDVWSRGFAAHERTRIRRILVQHEARIREAWDEHFGT